MTKYGFLFIAAVAAGALESQAAGTFVVTDGARLEGTGTIEAGVTMQSGSTFSVDVEANDPLDVIGALDVGSATLAVGTISGDGATLITSDSLTGIFADLPEVTQVQSVYWIHYEDVEGSSAVVINKSSAPTSSGIDLRAYQGADGVYVEFMAFDVESDGEIWLELDEQGVVAWQGTVSVVVGAEFVARFKVPGLRVGQSYDFKVRDEVGTWWTANGVSVGAFNAEMVGMTLSGATIAFDSIAGREYEVQWTAALSDDWQTVKTVLAESATTSVEVAFPEPGKPAGFFRTMMR
jgi:hypothetical protein